MWWRFPSSTVGKHRRRKMMRWEACLWLAGSVISWLRGETGTRKPGHREWIGWGRELSNERKEIGLKSGQCLIASVSKEIKKMGNPHWSNVADNFCWWPSRSTTYYVAIIGMVSKSQPQPSHTVWVGRAAHWMPAGLEYCSFVSGPHQRSDGGDPVPLGSTGPQPLSWSSSCYVQKLIFVSKNLYKDFFHKKWLTTVWKSSTVDGKTHIPSPQKIYFEKKRDFNINLQIF
jgi:hypothetical protein